MDAILQPYEHLKIQLKEIISATNNFDDENYIGVGGFGKVYKGELSHSKGRSMAAIKRRAPTHGQGIPEFLKEITMLSDYKHENLISLLGFCYEGGEMILIYEHASRGSLDKHLNSPHLTWTRRLKICRDVSKGLSYLHDPRGTHQRLIHCDMKSANILLDDQWKAKVSDFGLAIMGPANEHHSVIVTLAAGTNGYCDPQYAMTHTLTKESDVYSFGVVLYEVLCGRLCCTYRDGRVHNYVPSWIKSYKENNLKDIIYQNPTTQQLSQSSLKTFSDVVYRCLNVSRKDRPKIDEVVAELEIAVDYQHLSEWKLLFDTEKMTKVVEPPLDYSSYAESRKLMSEGVLFNDGKRWFSLNKKGEHCEMISFSECLDLGPSDFESSSKFNSRFSVGTYPYKRTTRYKMANEEWSWWSARDRELVYHNDWDFILKTRVKTQFLSPGVTYTVNLVFNIDEPHKNLFYDMRLRYKLQGETKTSITYLASEREDGLLMFELYQFTNDERIVDLEILFEGYHDNVHEVLHVEGIEFCPLEKVEQKDEEQPSFDPDAKWEENMPTDYEDIMKWPTNSVHWTTKKEAYSIIRKGFLINDGQKWFSLDKNGKYCHMILARVTQNEDNCYSLLESRFGGALEPCWAIFELYGEIEPRLVSSETTYASYLVYKLPKDQPKFWVPMQVNYKEYVDGREYTWYTYLVKGPQTPIVRPKADQTTHNPQSRPKLKGLPKQRDDGWMEVQIWEFRTGATTETIHMHLEFNLCGRGYFDGLLIEGVEFRPI